MGGWENTTCGLDIDNASVGRVIAAAAATISSDAMFNAPQIYALLLLAIVQVKFKKR